MRVPTAARVPPPDSREPSLYELIEFEVFDMVARGLPDGFGSGFVPLAVIAVLLQLLVSSPHFVRWVMVVATVLGFELPFASSTGATRSRSTASRWRQCLYVRVDASGFSRGVAGWLSVPAPWPAKGVVLALRLSRTVAVLANVGASLPLYAVVIAWALLPTAIYRAVLGGAMKLGLSVGALMMIVVLTVFASRFAAATHRSLRIGYANRRLARAPEQRTREAEQANLDKSRFIAVASQ